MEADDSTVRDKDGFDPLNPMVSSMSVPFADKAETFVKQFVFGRLVRMIEGGADCAEALENDCVAFENLFEECGVSTDDTTAPLLFELLQTLRGLRALLRPSCATILSEQVECVTLLDDTCLMKGSKQQILVAVGAALRASDHYASLLQEFRGQWKVGALKFSTQISDAMGTLTDGGDITQDNLETEAKGMHDILSNLPLWRASLRHDMLGDLEAKAEARMLAIASAFQGLMQTESAREEVTPLASLVQKALDLASRIFPASDALVLKAAGMKGCLVSAEAAKLESDWSAALTVFQEELRAFSEGTVDRCDAPVAAIRSAMVNVSASSAVQERGAAGAGSMSREIAAVILEFMKDSMTDSAPFLAVLSEMSALAPTAEREEARRLYKILDGAYHLSTSMKNLEMDKDKVAGSPTFNNDLKDLLRDSQALQQLVDGYKGEVNLCIVRTGLSVARELTDSATTHAITHLEDLLVSATQSLSKVNGGAPNGARWSDGCDDLDLKAILNHAKETILTMSAAELTEKTTATQQAWVVHSIE